jgi:hypothetical protein
MFEFEGNSPRIEKGRIMDGQVFGGSPPLLAAHHSNSTTHGGETQLRCHIIFATSIATSRDTSPDTSPNTSPFHYLAWKKN